jgi:transcriptional regulator with XRE-family HTH domain
VLAERLDHLFATVHPQDRKPYTPKEVAEAINQAAGQRVISPVYLWELKTGRSDNPTLRHIAALAAFFGVSPVYFFDDAGKNPDALPPDLYAALARDEVREMALRAAGLSDASLRAISGMIDSARTLESPPARRASRLAPTRQSPPPASP